MAKTKFQQELEKQSQGGLIRMCEAKDLDHTGDRSTLIARLVAFEKAEVAEPEPKEPEVETPPAGPDPETPAEDPEAETPLPSED